MPKLVTLTDQVRRAILAAPISRYELAKRLGISQGTLGDFVHGRTGIGSELLDRVAAELRLRLVVGRPRKARK
jgi:transcriptional regulator with XRE-family HTH domain